jgi:hypothetical protein
VYRDDENLKMYCTGTYYEVLPSDSARLHMLTGRVQFPIQSGSVYTGGSPGADRVVFNGSGTYCAYVCFWACYSPAMG